MINNISLSLSPHQKFDQIFNPYIKYCLDHSNCLQYVKEKHKENELFKAYLVWCETRKDCERLRLMDLLVKPMQRLTKYSLLLKAIMRKTESEGESLALKRMVSNLTADGGRRRKHFSLFSFYFNPSLPPYKLYPAAEKRTSNFR